MVVTALLYTQRRVCYTHLLAADVLYNGRSYPIDEAPAAYKDFDQVCASVEEAGLAKTVATLKARFVIKDNEGSAEGSA